MTQFDAAFYDLLRNLPRVAPSPTELNAELGRLMGRMNNLNGRESARRIVLLRKEGFRKNKRTGRWQPPAQF